MLQRPFPWLAVVGLAVLVCAAPAAFATPLQGGQAPLSTLIGADGIQCGDKWFHEFGYLYAPDMPAASQVNVACITVAGNLGIRFGGVSNVDIDGNNAFQIKAIGVVISTFDTLPRNSRRLPPSRNTFTLTSGNPKTW